MQKKLAERLDGALHLAQDALAMSEANDTYRAVGARIRAFRGDTLSLDDLADLIRDSGCERPSAAKLSRIETGIQPVPLDILPGLKKVTGLSRKELRPDLVEAVNDEADAGAAA
jgi:hypothetical protein